MSRAAMTGPARSFFLAISAFNSSATRARLDARSLHGTLEDILSGMEQEARSAGVDWDLYTQTKYALVALADDLALHSDWDHQETWNRYLLELRHFNTSFAGQEFFDRLNRLRQRLSTTHDAQLREQVLGALAVYLTCLEMGFRGRYRGAPQGELEKVQNALVQTLWPHGEAGLRSQAWPDAYGEAGSGRIASGRRLWWWPIPLSVAAAVALWFALSWVQTERVAEMADQVVATDGGRDGGTADGAGGD